MFYKCKNIILILLLLSNNILFYCIVCGHILLGPSKIPTNQDRRLKKRGNRLIPISDQINRK